MTKQISPVKCFKIEKVLLLDILEKELRPVRQQKNDLLDSPLIGKIYKSNGKFKAPHSVEELDLQNNLSDICEKEITYWANYYYMAEKELHIAGDKLWHEGHYCKAISLQLFEGLKITFSSLNSLSQGQAYKRAQQYHKLMSNS